MQDPYPYATTGHGLVGKNVIKEPFTDTSNDEKKNVWNVNAAQSALKSQGKKRVHLFPYCTVTI